MALDTYTGNETGCEVYQNSDGSIWRVLGYITKPAVILRNLETQETIVEIIGCPRADRWTRLIEKH